MLDPTKAKPGEVDDKDGKKVPAGTIEIVEGKDGQAAKLTFPTGRGLFNAPARGTPEWDQSAGFSFWIKGDGSQRLGGLELVDDTYKMRYGYAFPLNSTEWTRITVPWSDLTPELTGPFVDPAKGFAPSKFIGVFLGKWFYWGDYPPYSYAISPLVLEKTIATDPTDYTAQSAGLKRTAAKIKSKKPITIVTMGDSLTDRRHNSNTQITWADMLVQDLKEKHGVQAKLINPAVGGTTLSQNLITLPRWTQQTSNPDLVIINFGGNDWDTGVRGEDFKQYLRVGIDRIRRVTKGSADILLVTTAPGFKRFDLYKELEQAARDVAAEKKVGLADLAADTRNLGNAEDVLKLGYWHWDNVHLGPKGKEVFRDTVLKAITADK